MDLEEVRAQIDVVGSIVAGKRKEIQSKQVELEDAQSKGHLAEAEALRKELGKLNTQMNYLLKEKLAKEANLRLGLLQQQHQEKQGPKLDALRKEVYGEEELLDLLHEKYERYFDSGVAKRLEAMADKRTGCLVPEADGSVHKLGTYLPLQGYDEVVLELVKSLVSMSKFETTKVVNEPHAIRIIGPPGMGKSTVLSQGWYQLKVALEQPHSQANKALEDYPELLSSLKVTLNSDRMLVFIHEVQKSGYLSTDAVYGFHRWEVETLNIEQIVFLRVLHTALQFPPDHPELKYLTFVDHFFQDKKLMHSLRPDLVFRLLARLAGVPKDSQALVVFAIDELEGLMHSKTPDGKVFGQELLSQLVQVRHQLISDRQKVLPIYMAASTRASASSLRLTASAQSKVLDLHLPLLNFTQMEAVVLNIVQRLGWGELVLHENAKKVLHLLGGIPRVLEWCLVALSQMPIRAEKLQPDILLNSLRGDLDPEKILRVVVEFFKADARWGHFFDRNGRELVQVLATHDILRYRVSRRGLVPGQIDPEFTWQEAESEGLLTLVHERAAAAAGSATTTPPTSRRTSKSEVADGEGAGSRGAAELRGNDEVRDVVEPTALVDEPTSTDGADRSDKYFVAMHPLLLMAMELSFPQSLWQASFLPLLRLEDSWRSREETHLQLTVVRCSLLKGSKVDQNVVQLGDMYPVLHSRGMAAAEVLVMLPETTQHYQIVRKHLKEGDFTKLKEDLCAGMSMVWAFLGPGNFGADSWCIFKRVHGGGGFLVRTQTKKRQLSSTGKPQVLRKMDVLADVQREISQQGPADLTLWITDQELEEKACEELARANICVVTAGLDRVYYGAGCAVIKRAQDMRALKRLRVR